MSTRPIDPRATYLHLAEGPELREIAEGPALWAEIDQRADLQRGRLVTAFDSTEDWTVWERHPKGDEIVMVTSGAATVHLEDADGAMSSVTLRAPELVVVPAGSWHTADVIEPATMLVVTWGEGTDHRPR
jgi:mannose-6-phosphate isomerase-like protein (cupin superfamily)